MTIIHEFRGEGRQDQFGWIARNIGDVDGDGVNDFVTSAPTNSEAVQSGGKIYVYSGKSGALLWSIAGHTANGRLGSGVEAAGDVNGDGIPDVIPGAMVRDYMSSAAKLPVTDSELAYRTPVMSTMTATTICSSVDFPVSLSALRTVWTI